MHGFLRSSGRWWAAMTLFTVSAAAAEPAKAIRFNRDIRPIFSENCYACHGPDKAKRKSKLRLDTRDGIFGDLGGHFAVSPGKLEESELWKRTTSKTDDERMPPPESKRSLDPRQIERLRRWIEEGANWEGHWAYSRLEKPPVPEVAGPEPAGNPIDRFIRSKLGELGLTPAPEADRIALIRRLSFDLLGLPPEPEAVEAFLADRRPEAYEWLVDALLASPHYGERMAMYWLDLVRYADTTGIHGDNHRDVAPYRDYVIKAFNEDKPFDRFTIEQLAGDLLPNPTLEEKVASGYNRMNMTTAEGGAQAKEYIAKYAADRVRNASAVWLGSTLGCCECHNHKYDPFTMKDFYSLAAFFADIQEQAVALPGPPFPVPTPEQEARLQKLEGELAAQRKVLDASTPELEAAQAEWEASLAGKVAGAPKLEPWQAIGPFAASSFDEAFDAAFEPEKEIDLSKTYRDGKLAWRARPDLADGQVQRLEGANSATYLFRALRAEKDEAAILSLGSDDALKVWLNGKELLSKKVQRAAAPDQEQAKLELKAGENRLLLKIVNAGGDGAFYFKMSGSDFPPKIAAILEKPAGQRGEAEKKELSAHYRGLAPSLRPARERLAALLKEKEQLENQVPRTLISMAGEPRPVRLLPRGNWLEESGEVVLPAVPSSLNPLVVKDRRANRLDLARWLVSRDNPLAARVFINRLWKMFFGRGLAMPLNDFGSQGSWPTHPELLDWLAAEFMDRSWDVKAMVKWILMSETYRQSSHADPELRQRDPYNLYLARQGRFRLEAEMVRDGALSVSGLLVKEIGGPSVKPYQPAGYWDHLNFPTRTYQHDHGESLYRRGLYSYWCRTFLNPSLAAFDAPSREECTAERSKSNTPLQALVLLNDPTYVEAARVFAERVLKEGGGEVESRLRWALRRAVSRPAEAAEIETLAELYRRHLEEYKQDPEAAKQAASAGERPAAKDLEAAELAAWTSVCRTLLNLHEVVTRY
ncbi:MAG: PSD1 domain-containing protein [Planctomycetes bacterium]|nr:PSD1 domain-containing protein [Planctomycetota bacterium]